MYSDRVLCIRDDWSCRVFYICVVTGETFVSKGFEGSCAGFDGRTEVAIGNLNLLSLSHALAFFLISFSLLSVTVSLRKLTYL